MFTICAPEACLTTGKHCRKPPPRSNILPPNVPSGVLIMSFSVPSSAYSTYRLVMGALTKAMTSATIIWRPLSELSDSLKNIISSIFKGTLKAELNDHPPLNIHA